MSIEDVMSKYMNVPESPDGKSIIMYDKKGREWVSCCYCGQKNIPVDEAVYINHTKYKCVGRNCGREFEIDI